MSKTALILVDIQNDYFPGGKWEVHEMDKAATKAAHLLEDARQNNHLVVHIRHEIPIENPPFFAQNSKGAEISTKVVPTETEKVITKNFPNSFRQTDLKEYLDSQQVTAVVLCGAMSQMCIDGTARSAADFGYETTVIADACAAKEQSYDGLDVPAPMVHATIMSALNSYATISKTDDYLA